MEKSVRERLEDQHAGMPVIKLDTLHGCCLIVRHPTGIVYRSYYDRFPLPPPEVEGFCIPIDWDIQPLLTAIAGMDSDRLTRSQLNIIDRMLIHAWVNRPREEWDEKPSLENGQIRMDREGGFSFSVQWMWLAFRRPFSEELVRGLEVASAVLAWN